MSAAFPRHDIVRVTIEVRDDAKRRLYNQEFFTAIFNDDDGEPRVTLPAALRHAL